MVSAKTATQLILKTARLNKAVSCNIEDACGKILREDIKADRDYPPFPKALMDGIAINLSAWKKGQREYKIEKIIPAGTATYRLKNKNHAVHIMTGAVLPEGCDGIIPIEHIDLKEGIAHVKAATFIAGQSVRGKATDIKRGTTLLKKGARLTPTDIGIIVSVGKKNVTVAASFKVAVISTGDELVDVGKSIKPYQTRLSNAYALKAALESTALAAVDMFHLKDDKKVLTTALGKILKSYDVVILSGGVSQGAFDFIPEVLSGLGVKKIFHGIDQKPGKPFWFGTKAGKPVFALPGNPASTLVCAYYYVIPFLYQSAGMMYPQQSIELAYTSKHPSIGTVFVPVKNGKPMHHGGSGDFFAWGNADGFIAYDRQQKDNQRPYFSWRI